MSYVSMAATAFHIVGIVVYGWVDIVVALFPLSAEHEYVRGHMRAFLRAYARGHILRLHSYVSNGVPRD